MTTMRNDGQGKAAKDRAVKSETAKSKAAGAEGTNLSRRNFLAGAGVIAAGVAAAGLAGCEQTGSGSPSGNTAAITWDSEADAIVVGTGPAGLACAAAAAEGGASVIAIDANSRIGGKGILAGGNLGIGGGTRMQKDAGFEETAEIIFEDRTVPNLRTDKTMTVDTIDHRKYEMGQWRKISGAEDGEGMENPKEIPCLFHDTT